MVSPFICYSISFAVALVIYLLGWSELYPKLSASLVIFLLITIAANVFSHIKIKSIAFKKLENERLPVIGTTIFVYVLWIADFIYEGGIPLIKILFHIPYNYRLFGIPSLHVFTVTFSSFFTVYLFHLYMSKRTRLLLILYLVNLSAALLIYNRGMLFFNLTGSVVVYFMSAKKVSWRRVMLIGAAAIVLLFIFGVLGSLRVSREAHEPYNNENFMDVGKATESFRSSGFPKEYFWGYIYVTSSLANLQYNINEHPEPTTSVTTIFWTAVHEFLPDFITKRIHTLRGTIPAKEWRIGYSFTVHTVYSRAYSYSGWTGMMLMLLFVLTVPWIYVKAIDQESDFFITGWAILCTMYFFMAFDNTFRFTGLSVQLAYPIALALGEKYFNKKEKYPH